MKKCALCDKAGGYTVWYTVDSKPAQLCIKHSRIWEKHLDRIFTVAEQKAFFNPRSMWFSSVCGKAQKEFNTWLHENKRRNKSPRARH